MTISAGEATVPVKHTDRFFIGGEWVTPSSDSKIDVIDSHTEQVYLTVAEAQAADMDRAVTAAKEAFDHGPWPRLTHRSGPPTCGHSATRSRRGPATSPRCGRARPA